jgi:hypothetical protein
VLLPIDAIHQDISLKCIGLESTFIGFGVFVEIRPAVGCSVLSFVEVLSLQLNIHGIREGSGEELIGFYFADTHEVHDLQNAMGHTAGTGHHDLDVRQFEAKVGMDQLPEAALLVDPAEVEFTSPLTIGHDAVVSAHDPGEKTESDDPGAVVVFEAFIVDQGDAFIQDGAEEILILRLLLSGMGKEQIGFIGDERFDRDFLDAQEDITFREVVPEFHAGSLVFPVGKTAVWSMLSDDPIRRHVPVDPLALRRGEGDTVIGRNFSLFEQSNGKHAVRYMTKLVNIP